MASRKTNAVTLPDTDSLPDHPETAEAVSAFIEQLAREYFMDGPDRRSEPRYRITLPVMVEPLDDDLQPTGLRFRAITRDISESGVGLIFQDPVSGVLKMDVRGASGLALTVIAEVNRCESVGYYFNVGCNILTSDA